MVIQGDNYDLLDSGWPELSWKLYWRSKDRKYHTFIELFFMHLEIELRFKKELPMPQPCKIWIDFNCATVSGDDANGYSVNSTRAGNYFLTGTLIQTSEFTDLTIEDRVKLTDHIQEQNSQGMVPSFGSGDLTKIIRRPKKRTAEREQAFLKLVYQKDPNLGAVVGMADGTGLVGPQQHDLGNPLALKFHQDIGKFQAITSSRNVKDVHHLANALVESGRLHPDSTTTRYILSNKTFREIEEGRLGLSSEFYGDSSSISRFLAVATKIKSSSIEADVQRLIANDLEQARINYISGAYKSCVVLMGAALEGVMLGTLRRPDVIAYFRPNSAAVNPKLASIGAGHPQFNEHIGNTLKFEDMKNWLTSLIPEIANAGVGEIQDFRNAVHPNKALNDSTFLDFDETRATHYITAFEKIVDILVNWTP